MTETVETGTTETAANAPELLPDEREAEPYHFHRGMLRQLGSCGDYVRRHHQAFPTKEYPDGPPINSVTCRTHYQTFDWSWAIDRMLTYSGADEVDRVFRSRAERYAALGPRNSTERRAAAFGYVFATQPQYRREVMNELAAHATAHAESLARTELEEMRQLIRTADEQLEHWTSEKERVLAELPAIEEALASATLRAAAQLVEVKQREVKRAKAALTRLQREAADAVEAARQLEAAAGIEVETA